MGKPTFAAAAMTISPKPCLPLLSCLILAGFSEAGITIHGSSTAYTETGGDWLSMGTNDIDGSGGLGSDGWFFFGDFDAVQGGGHTFADHVESPPSYVTGFAQGADYSTGAGEFPGYGSIDDPNTLDGSDVVGAFGHSTNGGAGTNNEIITFTVAGLATDTVVRVGVLAGIEANSDGRWDPTSITLTNYADTATVGDHSTSPLPANPGGTNTGWVFFDIDADGTYGVSCTKRLSGQGAGIGGLTFDSLVVPTGPSQTLLPGRSIGIDFGTLATTSSSYFNDFSDVTIADSATESFADLAVGFLIDSTGFAVTGVGFSVTNKTGDDSGEAAGFNGAEGPGSMSHPTIYQDWLISNDSGSTGRLTDGDSVIDGDGDRAHFVLTFTGLDDTITYNLTGGFDNNGGNNNFAAIWQADGQEVTTSPQGAGDGFASFTGLHTDGSGNLVINVVRESNANGKHVTIAALELEAVSLTNPDGGLNFPLVTPAGGYSFPDAFPGLTFNSQNSEITALEALPGHPEKLFVVEANGMIWMIPDVTATTPTKVLLLDRSSANTDNQFNGMGGIAFHPDFDNNGYFYVTYPSAVNGSGTAGNWTRVSRFTVADPANITTVDNSTEQVLIEENYHRSHGFNRLIFGPDGYLYIPVGDGKQKSHYNRPPDRLTQTIDEGFWSSVLRIDVDKKPGSHEPQNLVSNDANGNWTIPTTGGLAHYSIPPDNPFLDPGHTDGRGISTYFGKSTDPFKVRTEMYCIGFRNPWKIGFVPGTNDLWVADVMGSLKERYMIMPPGGNAGWAYYSGTGDVEWLQTTDNIPAVTGFQYVQPVVEYYVTDSNSGAHNKSIIGGDFYQATDIPALTGAYLMCDFNRGDIWAIHRADHSAHQLVYPQDTGQTDPEVGTLYALDDVNIDETTLNGVFAFGSYASTIELIGIETGITAMLPNPTTGEMLLADSDNNIIRKLVYTPGSIDSQLPQTLAETGAFTDVGTLAVNPEMHPYDINLAFWSDGAIKSRWFNMVDATGPMQYSPDDFWDFPTGMIAMKHFDMDLDRDNPGTNVKRVETRFLVKTVDDFYAISYQWNDTGTEATLVPDEGVNLDLSIIEGGFATTQSWRIPSRAECFQCHTENNNVMLGFNTRQLNRDSTLADSSGNFLTLLENAGYLTSIGADPTTLPRHYQPGETAENLEERVRSYLAVNCGYCHYEGNNLVPDSWSGEAHLTIAQANLLHGEAIGFQVVDPTDRLIIPGDTANSIILSRAAATNGYGRMPPVATAVVDQEGVALLTDWINNYANAAPTIAAPDPTLDFPENAAATSPVGFPDASDPDAPDAARGTLAYSIIGGNEEGLFAINSSTGEITMAQTGPDYEELGALTYNLTIEVTDGFPANPQSASAVVPVDLTDVPNDDSQGDGIADEWALEHLGSSAVNPLGDSDSDGTVELFEYWGDSDPLKASESFVLEGVNTVPAGGYFFEWVIRDSLTADVDYLVRGTSDLTAGFVQLVKNVDYTIESTTPVPGKPGVSRVRIKVTTASPQYFLRISTP